MTKEQVTSYPMRFETFIQTGNSNWSDQYSEDIRKYFGTKIIGTEE